MTLSELRECLWMALDAIRSRKTRSFLTLLGVVIGVTSVIAVAAIIDGLNGYILLLHLGADRKDKMYRLLEPLVRALRERGYEFVRVDRMLQER